MTDETVTENITLLGSEMLTWSDLEGEVGGFGGLLAPQLVHGFGVNRGRALIVGPTTAEVVAEVAAEFAHATVLVRSYPDAQSLRADLAATIEVVCGPLDRLVASGATFDAVVAVSGTDRLHSAEEETPTTAQVLGDLAALVADGGELFVGVGNAVGIDRLLSLDAPSSHADALWPAGRVAAPGDLPARASVDGTAALLEALGLALVETWHCHGRRSDPLVAAPASTYTAHAGDTVLVREIAHAYDVHDASAVPLKDPAATLRDLVTAGLGAATAPIAIVHLRRGGSSAPLGDVVLVQEPMHLGSPAVAYRLTPSADGTWRRELVGAPQEVAVAPGLVRRTAALTGDIPHGPTLADALEACLVAYDVSAAGALVRQYRDWLAPDGADIARERVAMTPSLLVVTEKGLAPLDPGWVAEAGAPVDVVVLRGLMTCAAALLARGVRHPWSPVASARLIGQSLAAAADIEVPPTEEGLALMAAVDALDARLAPAGQESGFDAPANAGRLGYGELKELAEVAAARAAAADEHVFWMARRLQGSARTVGAQRERMHRMDRSLEMWVGRRVLLIFGLLRRLKAAVRARVKPAGAGEVGVWTPPPAPAEGADTEVVQIEERLLPPGYEHPRVEVVPDVPLKPEPRIE